MSRNWITAALVLLISVGSFASDAEDVLTVFMPPSDEELAEVADRDLRETLLRLASDDQRARLVGGCGDEVADPEAAARQVAAIDRANTEQLKTIIEEHGWPTVALVGNDGARAAWLLAQHADHDPEWQRHLLKLMEPHAGTGQADPVDHAYLIDRVRVNAGRPQLYGTQHHDVDGERQPLPIEDPETVDERRNKLGMRRLKSYTKFVNT